MLLGEQLHEHVKESAVRYSPLWWIFLFVVSPFAFYVAVHIIDMKGGSFDNYINAVTPLLVFLVVTSPPIVLYSIYVLSVQTIPLVALVVEDVMNQELGNVPQRCFEFFRIPQILEQTDRLLEKIKG